MLKDVYDSIYVAFLILFFPIIHQSFVLFVLSLPFMFVQFIMIDRMLNHLRYILHLIHSLFSYSFLFRLLSSIFRRRLVVNYFWLFPGVQ